MKFRLITLGSVINLLIVSEILFMISPFALYYYAGYGHLLHFLRDHEYSSWLNGFFLPHFNESSVWLINAAGEIGEIIFLGGLVLFLIPAGQIYYSKFTRKTAVTGGLYRLTRHPQYMAFAVMGFGLLLVWPRFFVLAGYVTMLFVYYGLAKKEERDCARKYGAEYENYLKRTNDSSLLNRIVFGKYPLWGVMLTYAVTMILALSAAFGIRDYSITTIPVHYSENAATVSMIAMSDSDIRDVLNIASQSPTIQLIQSDTNHLYLNYIVPAEWRLADLPMEPYNQGEEGHIQPDNISREEFKVLFTRALVHTENSLQARDILKKACGREPIALIKVNLVKKEILSADQPPPHVVWGDIPTPLF